jgi:hypothetical protein
MKRLLLTTAAFAFAATMATAAINTDDLVADFQAEGYTRVEVKVGLSQIKVEAIKGEVKREVIYDIESGAILKDETETVEADDDTAPGVEIKNVDKDFVDGDDEQDDDDDDDDDDGDDGEDEDDDNDDDDEGDEDDSDDEDNSGPGGGDDDDGDDNSGHGNGDDD